MRALKIVAVASVLLIGGFFLFSSLSEPPKKDRQQEIAQQCQRKFGKDAADRVLYCVNSIRAREQFQVERDQLESVRRKMEGAAD